jgi:hypothetical protein
MRQIRTLWFIGVMGLAVAAAGCIETGPHHGRYDNSPTCLDNQYYTVQWGIDHGVGTLGLSCSEIGTMASHVELTTTATYPDDVLVAAYNLDCNDHRVCSDGSRCNMQADTAFDLPVGTTATSAALIASDNTVLSTAVIDPVDYDLYTLTACQSLVLPFVFTLPTAPTTTP